MPLNDERGATTLDRFSCWITIEDISLSLSASQSQDKSYWDEIRVTFKREGITQHTRWISPLLAIADARISSISESGEGSDDKSKSVINMSWSSVNTAAFLVNFKSENETQEESFDPRYEKQIHSKNLQYLVSENEPNASESGHTNVCPKTIRPLMCSVECQKNDNIFSASGGAEIEQNPTSAAVETVSSYYARSSSWVSALIKKATTKLKPEKGNTPSAETSPVKGDNSKSRSPVHSGRRRTSKIVAYATENNGIDPSEAYNAHGGKRQFSLELVPADGYASTDITGAPVTLHFTMVAHFERNYTPPLRDYHSNVILLDQIVLDVSDANRTVTSKKMAFGKPSFNFTQSSKKVEAYGFGFTSNTSSSHDFQYTSPLLSTSFSEHKGEPRILDFPLLSPTPNEPDHSGSDFAKSPTSVCIVSSKCDISSKRDQIGNRVVSVSRFKTALNGLCKPSYKCQLVIGLMRRYSDGHVETERCNHPIDLSSIINREFYPDKVRQIVFSKGEVMNFRLRRRCFSDAEYHRCDVLLPCDYDATDGGESYPGVVESEGMMGAKANTTPQKNSMHVSDNGAVTLSHEKPKDSTSASVPSAMDATKALMSYNNYEDGSYHAVVKETQETAVAPKIEKVVKPSHNLTKEPIKLFGGGTPKKDVGNSSLKFISFKDESNVMTQSHLSDDAVDDHGAKDYEMAGEEVDKPFINPFESIDRKNLFEESSERSFGVAGFPYLSIVKDETEKDSEKF